MGKKTERNSYKIRNKQACPPSPSLFTIVLEILTREIKKKIEGDQGDTNWKERRLSIFVYR